MLDIPADWLAAMRPFLKIQGVDLNALEAFLDREYAAGQVFPPRHQIFRAFAATPFDEVRLLLLGQDPYHEAGQACGLAFSVPPDTKAPASLRNILKEYAEDVGKRHERAERALPGELKQSDVIGMLQRNALRYQIQLVSVSPGQIKKESSLMVLPIQIKLNCDYFQLLDFLQSLQEEERFIKLDKLCARTVDNRLSFEIEAAVYAMEDSGQTE